MRSGRRLLVGRGITIAENLTRKILAAHLVDGELIPGHEIGIRIDHTLLQTDFKNSDDHRYLQTACARYGIHFSRPGNGISHQAHMERFDCPGLTMLGANSHTPAATEIPVSSADERS